ncbi:MAG: hypothetical protein D5S00_01030 [Tindallia sp. MSAO_Bac2]|nr:MAG: hypothetical protein D5S00_01030 [Tindallia sp. MSAO_Bac2]
MKKFVAIIGIIMLLQSALIPAHANNEISREEINEIIEEVALQKSIPPVLLRAIAWKESGKSQFRNGQPFIYAGNQGIMQINEVHNSRLDREALLYDTKYNIEVGADILLSRWLFEDIATVGDRDPDVLENWYFALWGYNGWLNRNNPTDRNGNTYQDGIFDLIRTRYNVAVTDLDWSQVPSGIRTPLGFNIPNPDTVSRGHLLFYQPGDRVKAAPQDLRLSKDIGGEQTNRFSQGSQLRVTSNARLENGVYWYRLESFDSEMEGWARSLDLIPVAVAELDKKDVFRNLNAQNQEQLEPHNELEEIEEPEKREKTGEPVFIDMEEHMARYAVERLNAAGVVSGVSEDRYEPDRPMTRQELAVVFEKAFDLDNEKAELQPEALPQDWDKVSEWAQDSLEVAMVYQIITGHTDGTVRPTDHATREQGLMMLTRALELDLNQAADVEPAFGDAHRLSEWAVPAVNLLIESEILEASEEMNLNPGRAMTRAEMAILLDRAVENHFQ